MRIVDELLDSVVYIYPDAISANAGAAVGATGFLADYRFADGATVRYVITNTHVVLRGGTFLRYNKREGGIGIEQIPVDNWTHAGGHDDVSVAVLSNLNGSGQKAIPWQDYGLLESEVEEFFLGAGDEVVMLGRLSGYEGLRQNRPVARFGNIAQMPHEPVLDASGNLVEVFLVEMRSLSGFSGSPVVGVIPPGSFRRPGEPIKVAEAMIFLLGIDTGHITFRSPVVDARGSQQTDLEIRQHSGISLVVPAWQIERLLRDARPST